MPAAVSARSGRSLTCSDVSVRAGKREVVAPFSWSRAPGGITWLLGSNGSGKSSLLRVLAGWQRPSSGSVLWPNTAKLHYYAPVMSAPADLRVRDYVAFVRSATAGSESTELDELWPPLADPGNRFRNLSTGEAKRLMLWSILRQPPGPLILDEPYEHLSREGKAALTTLLRGWAHSAVVIVATNQDVPSYANDTLLTLSGTHLEIENAS